MERSVRSGLLLTLTAVVLLVGSIAVAATLRSRAVGFAVIAVGFLAYLVLAVGAVRRFDPDWEREVLGKEAVAETGEADQSSGSARKRYPTQGSVTM